MGEAAIARLSKPMRDVHGRLIAAGDLVRLSHSTNHQRKKIHIHRLVIKHPEYDYLVVSPVCELVVKGFWPVDCCPLAIFSQWEIIDGLDDSDGNSWWERATQ